MCLSPPAPLLPPCPLAHSHLRLGPKLPEHISFPTVEGCHPSRVRLKIKRTQKLSLSMFCLQRLPDCTRDNQLPPAKGRFLPSSSRLMAGRGRRIATKPCPQEFTIPSRMIFHNLPLSCPQGTKSCEWPAAECHCLHPHSPLGLAGCQW